MGNTLTVIIGQQLPPESNWYVCWGNYQDFYGVKIHTPEYDKLCVKYAEKTPIATFSHKLGDIEFLASALCGSVEMEDSKARGEGRYGEGRITLWPEHMTRWKR